MKIIVQMLFYLSAVSVTLIIGIMLLISLIKDYKRIKKDLNSK